VVDELNRCRRQRVGHRPDERLHLGLTDGAQGSVTEQGEYVST